MAPQRKYNAEDQARKCSSLHTGFWNTGEGTQYKLDSVLPARLFHSALEDWESLPDSRGQRKLKEE